MEKLLDNLTVRVDGVLEGLSARDRKLLGGLVGFVVLLFVLGGGFLMKKNLDGLDSKLQARRDDLAQAEILQAQLESTQQDLAKVEERMSAHAATDLSSFMEKAASNVNIRDRLDSVRETGSTELGKLVQKNYSVSVSKISLEQTVDFLYELEAAGYPLRITSANFKVVKVSGENMLNLKLDVATFSMAEEG